MIVVAAIALALLLPITGLPGSIPATGAGAIHVPRGFKVELAASAELTSFAMMGTLDDRGRLFLCESSGDNPNNTKMLADPDFRIRMLEDTDGDGVFDRSKVFADKLTFPAGAVWHRGSLYVAAPPDLIRFDDTDGDGVADHREVLVTGWNFSHNAASLHGPFLGPDGWLYLTDGRHGFKIRSKEGKLFEGLASRIWRVRPDGSGLEWMSGGGFDNPVELVFTAPGETIGTMTYFQDPRDGQRDALLHFVEGGVYPKPHASTAEFQRTGELMPVMTKFARIAPAGLMRYRGAAFGPLYRDNLFSAQFNPHRVQRHVVTREGATFSTVDEDFLTSSDPDFHPTDVMEDADGSLLVVDTGAWFVHGCPISRVSKPEVKGAIYRIRKIGAPAIADAYGKKLALEAKAPAAMAPFLEDKRPVVRDRAMELLIAAGDPAVAILAASRLKSPSVDARCAALWGLFRIGTPGAAEAVRAGLRDPDFRVRVAAARASGMAKDTAALDGLMTMAQRDQPAVRRQAATALGQIGEARSTSALLAAAPRATDRFIEHSVIYSLMQIGPAAEISLNLKNVNPHVRKAALIALDQMNGAPLTREQFTPFLSDASQENRTAALWVASRHADWSPAVLSFLDGRLRSVEFDAGEGDQVRDALLAFCTDRAVQSLVADRLRSSTAKRQQFLLDAVDGCAVQEFPAVWSEALRALLKSGEPAVRFRAITMIRSHQLSELDGELREIAGAASAAAELRVAALGALVSRHPEPEDASLRFLLSRLTASIDASVRLSAAQTIGKAKLTPPQLVMLAQRHLGQVDSLILPSLLDAYRNGTDEGVGRALVAALLKSKVSIGEPDAKRLDEILKSYPAGVREAAHPLVAKLEQQQKARILRLQKLEPLLAAGGDIGRGRRLFFGEKVACYSCHTIGKEGGHVGPDLTAIGAIRSGHDLLEAIVFPSASFVPGHEIYIVETAIENYSGVRGDGPPGMVTLVTGPNAEVRIPRGKVLSMKPSAVSLMPEGLDESLTRAEFVDLLAFLQSQKSR
ncbi:MAG: PVC-type heme-binding CxxCH protein [Bryobacteraceae bacterium]